MAYNGCNPLHTTAQGKLVRTTVITSNLVHVLPLQASLQSIASVGDQHAGRKYELRRLPSKHRKSATISLVSPRHTLPQRSSGPIPQVRDTPRTEVRPSCSNDSPPSSPVSCPAVPGGTSNAAMLAASLQIPFSNASLRL